MADNNIDAFEFLTGKSTESINVRFWFEMFYEEKEYAAVVLQELENDKIDASYNKDTRELIVNGMLIDTVENYGGEGQGDEYWVVISVTDIDTGETKFIRNNGWYASYDGGYFDDNFGFQVYPQTVMTTDWSRDIPKEEVLDRTLNLT